MTDTDDAPLWAEACALALILGLLFRWMVHVAVAGEWLASDISWPPRLETLASPVAELRGTRLAVAATTVSVCVGSAIWLMSPAVAAAGILAAYLKLQTLPLLADPVALALAQYRATDQQSTTQQMTNSNGGQHGR